MLGWNGRKVNRNSETHKLEDIHSTYQHDFMEDYYELQTSTIFVMRRILASHCFQI